EQRRVGQVALRIERRRRSWKIECDAKLAAQRRIGADHRHGVTCALRREIVDESRARGGPRPGAVALPFDQEILLVIVEVGWRMAGVILARRRAERAEMHAVIFGALNQMYVFE